MQTWACGHEGEEGHSKLCPHLVGANIEGVMYFRVLRSKGIEAGLCCRECGEFLKLGEFIKWVAACQECVKQLDENEGDVLGWIGLPDIKEREVRFKPFLTEIILADGAGEVIAWAPLSDTRFVCYKNSRLSLVDEAGSKFICSVSLTNEKNKAWSGHHLTPRLHISDDGRFVVVCHDYGRFGQVVELQTARVTMQLERGTHHPETQPFPITFFSSKGRSLLIHAVDWNRLEISDPQTGELLVAREPLNIKDRDLPEHYLDFFHGSLLVSPDATWIADDGWVWQPVGEIAVWNLNNWLDSNLYESEDGGSRRMLCWRENLWDIPIAWVDNEHLAVWGIGRDDEAMLSGARIFSAFTGKETATFAGPSKNAFFGGDGRLFSVEADGLHIWNADSGARLGRIDGFKPKWQRGDFLIELNRNKVRSWNWRTAFE